MLPTERGRRKDVRKATYGGKLRDTYVKRRTLSEMHSQNSRNCL